MFYVSAKKGDKFGITDTNDGVTEFYTLDYIRKIQKLGHSMAGLTETGNCYVLSKKLATLWYFTKGMGVRVKLSKDLDWKQTLFMGYKEKDGLLTFYFADGDGLNGYFGLTSKFITNSGVDFDYRNNDPVECTKIKERIARV